MTLTVIAAFNRRRVIGRNGSIPWHLPEDLQQFKRITMGGTLIMGRRTYESIGKSLPGRRIIVVTTQSIEGAGIERVRSVEDALLRSEMDAQVFAAGGEGIYRALLEQSDAWRLTIVEDESDGDAFFPPYEHLIGSHFALQQTDRFTGFRVEQYRRIRSDDRPEVR